jgi:hypothetical protein
VTIAPCKSPPAPLLAAAAIDGAGKLTFKPTTDRTGSSLVTVAAMDNGGTGNGDDTGLPVTITVSGSNDPPRERR